MIYKMGDITHFSDVRSSPVKAIVISMIDQDKVVAPDLVRPMNENWMPSPLGLRCMR